MKAGSLASIAFTDWKSPCEWSEAYEIQLSKDTSKILKGGKVFETCKESFQYLFTSKLRCGQKLEHLYNELDKIDPNETPLVLSDGKMQIGKNKYLVDLIGIAFSNILAERMLLNTIFLGMPHCVTTNFKEFYIEDMKSLDSILWHEKRMMNEIINSTINVIPETKTFLWEIMKEYKSSVENMLVALADYTEPTTSKGWLKINPRIDLIDFPIKEFFSYLNKNDVTTLHGHDTFFLGSILGNDTMIRYISNDQCDFCILGLPENMKTTDFFIAKSITNKIENDISPKYIDKLLKSVNKACFLKTTSSRFLKKLEIYFQIIKIPNWSEWIVAIPKTEL